VIYIISERGGVDARDAQRSSGRLNSGVSEGEGRSWLGAEPRTARPAAGERRDARLDRSAASGDWGAIAAHGLFTPTLFCASNPTEGEGG
jgi:hypothetical protein